MCCLVNPQTVLVKEIKDPETVQGWTKWGMEEVVIVYWGNMSFFINQVIKWNLSMIALEMETFQFAEWMNGICSCNTLSKDAGSWWDLACVSGGSAQIK